MITSSRTGFGCLLGPHRRPTALGVSIAIGLLIGSCSLLPDPDGFEIPANDPSFRTRVYAGATMGNSHLTPDTSGTVFSVDNSDDLGTQMKLGVDVHNMLAVELDTSVLGTATLRQAGTDVNYSAASVSGLVYGLNGVQMRSLRQGWSAYGRFGIGILKKSSAVVALEEGGTTPILGLGAEYGFSNGLGIRGEITRFDDDAVYAGIGAVYRFGLTPRDLGGMLAEAVEPALASRETRVAEDGRTLNRRGRFGRHDDEPAERAGPIRTARGPVIGSRWRPRPSADDRDGDGIRDERDLCPDTLPEVTVGAEGCGLFDAVLSDVVFKSGSHWLTARARGQLDEFAERLLAFPEARVRVLAHTDATGTADANLALSARRAEAVVQYLQSRGVAELQLEGRGLGETRPLASNADREGRERNRRVEVVTLANLDDELIARRRNVPDDEAIEEPRWLPPAPRPSAVAVPSTTTAARAPAHPVVESPARVAEKLAERAADGPAGRASAEPSPESPDGPPSASPKGPPSASPKGPPSASPKGPPSASPNGSSTTAGADAVAEGGTTRPPGPWRASYEPTFGGARPAVPAAEAVTALLDGRPTPLPRPGFVPGLELGGVIDGVGFVTGSAELAPSARAPLARVAAELREHPEARIAIMAHTDERGSEVDNLALSGRRAESVLEHLVGLGIERERLVAEGYGETLPLVQNVTAEDRARNRRVEIRVLR